MTVTPAQNAELARFNQAVKDAVDRRQAWLDEQMALVSKYKIGEMIYDLNTGSTLGEVVGVHRYHTGDARYDDSLIVYYTFRRRDGVIDNTSRYHISIGTKEDLIVHRENELKLLKS